MKKGNFVHYRQLIEGLMYMARTSRPDIGHAISYLSRFLEKYTQETFNAGNRIFRYLKGIADQGFTHCNNKFNDTSWYGYSDANWGTDQKEKRSIRACTILFRNNLDFVCREVRLRNVIFIRCMLQLQLPLNTSPI